MGPVPLNIPVVAEPWQGDVRSASCEVATSTNLYQGPPGLGVANGHPEL